MSARSVYTPGLYYGLTFLGSYAIWLVAYYLQAQGAPSAPLVGMSGMLVPFVISLIMIVRSGNPALRKDFVNRLVNLGLIQPRMLPAFFLIPLTIVVAIFLSLPFGGSPEQLRLAEGFSFSTGAVPVLLFLVLAACFEELGWRGYGFESLQSRYTYLTASLIFGLLWSIWHIPLIVAEGQYANELWQQNIWFALNYFVAFIPLGVIVSWICIKSGKSILAAVLVHFLLNIAQETFAVAQTTKCIQTLVLVVVAIGIVAYDQELFRSKAHLDLGEGHALSPAAAQEKGATSDASTP
ncbi:CPBP family intramembrane metalloprotease [Chloroflexales bacterium ZM16-3]|nr:CPBP family intramembrane metalloprotease [Chloroflexales bacterium ZM16-3]